MSGPGAIYKNVNLLNGSSSDLGVNGSSTPVNFDFSPSSGEVWYLDSIGIFLQDNGTTLPTSFGAISNGLTNGVDILVKTTGVEYTISNMKNNIDINLTFKEHPMVPGTSGLFESSDIYIGMIIFRTPIKLNGNTSDYIRAKVRDNLTGVDQLKFRATLWRPL